VIAAQHERHRPARRDLFHDGREAGARVEDLRQETGLLVLDGERFGLRRAERAILRATDLDGKPFEIQAEGWLARIFQHEYDHLDGTLYVDRLGEKDQRIVAKITRKLGWGKPGVSWLPGVDHLED